MESIDQRTVMCVAAGFAAGAFLGAHLKGMSWCPVPSGRRRAGGSSGARVGTKDDFIDMLGLIPHPEGGFFVETYRSGSAPMTSKGLTDPAGDVMTTDRGPHPSAKRRTSIHWPCSRASPQTSGGPTT